MRDNKDRVHTRLHKPEKKCWRAWQGGPLLYSTSTPHRQWSYWSARRCICKSPIVPVNPGFVSCYSCSRLCKQKIHHSCTFEEREIMARERACCTSWSRGRETRPHRVEEVEALPLLEPFITVARGSWLACALEEPSQQLQAVHSEQG